MKPSELDLLAICRRNAATLNWLRELKPAAELALRQAYAHHLDCPLDEVPPQVATWLNEQGDLDWVYANYGERIPC